MADLVETLHFEYDKTDTVEQCFLSMFDFEYVMFEQQRFATLE